MKPDRFFGMESLEGRALLNAAPEVGSTVAVSVSLARLAPNGETVSWSYDELLYKSGAFDSDGDPISFFVSFFSEIPWTVGQVSNGTEPLDIVNHDPNALPPDSPYFIRSGESLVFSPVMHGRSSVPLRVVAYDGQASSTQFYLAAFTDLGSPGGGGKAGGSGSSGGTGGSGGSGGGTSGPGLPTEVHPYVNLPITLEITKEKRFFELTYDELVTLSGTSNSDLASGTLSLASLSNGIAKLNGVAAKPGDKLKAGDVFRWETTENRVLLDAFTVRLQPAKGDPIDTPFRVRQPNFWDVGVGPFEIPADRSISGVTNAQGFEIRAWRNADNESLLEVRAPRDPSTNLPGDLRQYDLFQSFQVLELFSDPLLYRSTIDDNVYLAYSLQDGGTVIRKLTVSPDLSISLGDNLLTSSITGAGDRFTQLIHLPLAGENSRTIIAARNEFTNDLKLFTQTRVGLSSPWRGVDIDDALFNNNQTPANIVGKIIGYRTAWGGWNLAGLDDKGNLRTVWTGSPEGDIFASDLSRISNGPKFTGGLSAYITPWNGINLTGQTADGSLVVTWWVPAFGGNWTISNFSELFGGAKLTSVASYTTSWNALNIVGVDESGQIRVYWWEPTRAANPATDVWSLDTLASAGFKRGEKLSVSFDQTSGRIRIYGPSNANDLPTSLSWAPGDGGRWSFDEA